MADDAWGDLFAKAANAGASECTTSEVNQSDENIMGQESPTDRNEELKLNRRRKKNRKRKRYRDDSQREDDESSEVQDMLQSRITPLRSSTAWPGWIRLQKCISPSRKCDGSEVLSSSDPYSKCQSCGQSALHHQIETENKKWHDQQMGAWPFLALVALRNLRCCASLLAQSMISDGQLQCLSSGSSLLSSLKPFMWRQLPQGEARILESKLSDVLRYCNLLSNGIHGAGRKKKTEKKECLNSYPSHFGNAVRLVISCDAMYYRTYYLQLVSLLPNIHHDGKMCFLPHPSHYFGLDFFTIDQKRGRRLHDRLVKFADDGTETTGDDVDWIRRYHSEPSLDHPLAFIHFLRRVETTILFHGSGWTHGVKTQKQAKASLDMFLDDDAKHETPAVDLLVEWRDSCRDFLCNLYAYSTVSSVALQNIVDFLYERKVGLVEIGSGTGYIAKLLQAKGLSVDAWDIHPTGGEGPSTNEYHGGTPSFCSVCKASNLPLRDCKSSALMLCYPPPESSMAHDTLIKYLNSGGNHLVHIGEFKGLTGDSNFERLLTTEMTCHSRMPCLTWGTDASHVSIWVKKRSETQLNELLLPCSRCAVREGVKRCRLARDIVYCSRKCFEEDGPSFSQKLQLAMTPLDRGLLSFSNSHHFSSL